MLFYHTPIRWVGSLFVRVVVVGYTYNKSLKNMQDKTYESQLAEAQLDKRALPDLIAVRPSQLTFHLWSIVRPPRICLRISRRARSKRRPRACHRPAPRHAYEFAFGMHLTQCLDADLSPDIRTRPTWKTAWGSQERTMDKVLESTSKAGINTKLPTCDGDNGVFTSDVGAYRKRK